MSFIKVNVVLYEIFETMKEWLITLFLHILPCINGFTVEKKLSNFFVNIYVY